MLYPIAPHITHYLWKYIFKKKLLFVMNVGQKK